LTSRLVGDHDELFWPCIWLGRWRVVGSLSDCWCHGTNRMCPAGMRISVRIFWCPLIDAAAHGVPSQTGRIRIARNAVSVSSEDARACRVRTACRISSGSYSGLPMQDTDCSGMSCGWPVRRSSRGMGYNSLCPLSWSSLAGWRRPHCSKGRFVESPSVYLGGGPLVSCLQASTLRVL